MSTKQFNPDFSKVSNYNPETAFTQIRFGFGAPLLEVEMNEMQEIQEHFRKKILLNLYGNKNGLKSGEFFYDAQAHTLRYLGLTLLINGDFYDLGDGDITVTPNQTITLAYEKRVLNETSTVYKQGKLGVGEELKNPIVDERVGEETSRRVQAQFNFKTYDGEVTPNVEDDEMLFGYVDMSGNFKVLAEEITVESARTIEPQPANSIVANFPVGASNFYLDNQPKYSDVGDLIENGKAEQLGYDFPEVAVYPDVNIITEKYANGYATQYAYLGNGLIFFREIEGNVFGNWIQIIDGLTFVAYQERVNKQILDLTMEVAILSNATSSGVDSNIVVETFKSADDIKLIKGKYDPENKRVYLDYQL